jgi:thioredoxin-dependent peroxiredoxin
MHRLAHFFFASALVAALAFSPAQAQDVALRIGDRVPAFEAPAADGSTWRSADHVGNGLLVVYFYPAAMTGGCTAQACSFRDNRTQLNELGAEVVGISGDAVDGLAVFRRANRINFPLLSDSDGAIARSFGVPVREGGTFRGEVDGEEVELRRGVTAARWTFIIAADGRVAYINRDVDAAGDGEAVLSVVAAMQNGG